MGDESLIDKRLLRRSFEQAAATYDSAAVLQREVCRRVLDRLDYIKIEPRTILDAGSGTGGALSELARRYPRAHLVALDIALAMLLRGRVPWWERLIRMGRRPCAVCGDIEYLPLADASADMVWSNLALQWVNDLNRVFSGMWRVLAPGGLLMFSTFGPDTLKELRHAYRSADAYTHVNRFVDMHDIGDIMVHSGFADPVMDMEYFTLSYTEVRELMRDLKAIGAHNVTRGRPIGLSGKTAFSSVVQNYEAFRRDGKLPATFEIVYGHAWKPQRRRGPGGRPIIEIKPRPGD